MKNSLVDKEIDKETDAIKWIDLIIFRAWLLGNCGDKIPVDWARERMTKFMSKPTKVEFFDKNGKARRFIK